MEFILQQQAKAEGQMVAIRKLIQTGMRMIVKQGEQIAKHSEQIARQGEHIDQLRVEIQDLARTQRVTEVKLQGLIDVLRRRGGNGSRSR